MMVPGAVRPRTWRVVLTMMRRLAFVVTAILLIATLVTGSKEVYQIQFIAFMSLLALMIASKATEPVEEEPEVDVVRQKALEEARRELDEIDALVNGNLPQPKTVKAFAPTPEEWNRIRSMRNDPKGLQEQVAEDYKRRLELSYGQRVGAEYFDVFSNDGTLLERYEMPKVGYHENESPPQLLRKVYSRNETKAYTGVRSGGGASC